MSLHAYEAAKADWISRHPQATPEEYQRAMASLARRYGV
jgi:hypothetical protein